MYVCMCVCVYVRMYVCMYVCMHVCMHVCKYICIYIYIYIFIYKYKVYTWYTMCTVYVYILHKLAYIKWPSLSSSIRSRTGFAIISTTYVSTIHKPSCYVFEPCSCLFVSSVNMKGRLLKRLLDHPTIRVLFSRHALLILAATTPRRAAGSTHPRNIYVYIYIYKVYV